MWFTDVWFNNWEGIFRTLVSAVAAYIGLIMMLRISGKRTLSKMNAFDLVVTVALGSILATILLSKEVAIAEGLVAFGSLIILQWMVAQMSLRSKFLQNLVKSDPTLLLYKGNMLEETLKDERVVPEEVRAAVRSSGVLSMDQVHAVVLETDGSFSVIPTADVQSTSALQDVHQQRPKSMV